MLAARQEDKLAKVVEDCRKHGGKVEGVRCDVTQQADVNQLAQTARQQFGRVDALVNNAGVGTYAYLEELQDDDWLRMLDVNLTGVFRVTKALLPLIRKAENGQIVNISSVRGLEAIARTTGYAASKFGLIGFSEALAKEVRKDGIRVTALCPGGIRSHFGGTSPEEKPPGLLEPEDVAEAVRYTLLAPPRVEITRLVFIPFRPE